tara:strand:- start:220 stop:894 length:675 start_codon:yes stop_codon:yes gene_type:complete
MFDESDLLTKRKKICWKSWNALMDEYLAGELAADQEAKETLEEMRNELESTANPELSIFPFGALEAMPRVVNTPLGVFSLDSMFKPSDRWDCWIGSTNFSITHVIKNTLKETEGIEVLRIMGRYTFFVGIATLFDFKDVRLDIEKSLCGYTEKEVLSNEETLATVNLVKDQLKTMKYWSILVAPTGKVDYVVSDSLDQAYLDGLNELLELKQILGGIILRGDHG